MRFSAVRMFRLALVGAVVVVAACAGAPPRAGDGLGTSRERAVETVAAGYGNIVEKYIEPVDAAGVALPALKGISGLDPALTARKSGDSLVLVSHGQTLRRFPLPDPNDVQGWAALTVDVYAAGRLASPELTKVSMEKIYQTVFDGAVAELDMFTRYSGAVDAQNTRVRRDGFGGVGVQYVVTDGVARITVVSPDTPAENAGMRPNDVISRIDGELISEMSLEQISERLRGRIGSPVRLTLQRAGDQTVREFSLVRGLIVPRSVTAREQNGVLVLRVATFNQNTAHSFHERVVEWQEKLGLGLKGIVLDLRGNTGGLLNQAIRIADLLLEKGDISNTRGRHPGSIQHYEASSPDIAAGLPVAVLIDGRSASASEVLAAALQDQNRAVVIGTTSYGKGTVQTVIRLPNDGEMTLTWSRLLAPSGYALHELGIHPTICTSGLGASPAPLILTSARGGEEKESQAIAEWRRVAINDLSGRASLRGACPAEIRNDDTELDLALRVIAEPNVYHHWLDFTAMAEAMAPRQSAGNTAAPAPRVEPPGR